MGRKALLGRLLLSEVQTAALLRRGVLVGSLLGSWWELGAIFDTHQVSSEFKDDPRL